MKYLSGLSLLALLIGAAPAFAQPTGETPLWLRHASISPDGDAISFTYRGQIFIVPSDGGLAVPLTAQGNYSHRAVWAPDSDSLAFASNLNATDDIYLSDFSGTLKRLSWSSRNEAPVSFTPDGQSILYSTTGLGDAERSVQAALSFKPQLYALNTETGRESLVLPNFSEGARWNGSMDKLVYVYDPARDASIRQHRVAANARQLYIYDQISGRHERLFPVDGVDRLNPVWSADNTTLYYLSESSGRLNVWSHKLGSDHEQQITFFEDAPVRDLSISQDDMLAFINDGRIFTKGKDVAEAAPLVIQTLDQHAYIDQNVRIEKYDEFTSSPDGQHFAFTAYGNVFLADRQGNYRQLTTTATEERNIEFSPDGSALIYASQRDHQWGLYRVQLVDETYPSPMSHPFNEETLYVPEVGNAFQPAFSPDGTKIGFVADRREVKVLDLASGEVTALFGPEDYNSSYHDGDLWFSWSPTSQDIALVWRTISATGSSAVAIVPADGSSAPVRVTQSLTDFSNVAWSTDGSQLIGKTTMFSARTAQLHATGEDLYRIFVSEAAYQDFQDLADGEVTSDERGSVRYVPEKSRSSRLEGKLDTSGIVLYHFPYADGLHMGLVARVDEQSFAIQMLELATGEISTLQVVNVPNAHKVTHVAATNVIDFVTETGVVSVPMFDPNGVSEVNIRAYTRFNPDQARRAAFEQVWADIRDHFYSAELEGRDWRAIGEKYRSYLGSVASNREFAELIETMMGELSASHLFSNYQLPEGQTAGLGTHNDVLGVYLDYGFDAPGRRIAAILPGGPLDRQGLDVEAGDVIVSINGQAVPDAGGIERLLDVNLGKKALLGITDADGSNERLISVMPIEARQELRLANQRWRDTRRELVETMSNGCVAYQYVPAMDEPSYTGLLGHFTAMRETAKAALVDIRTNGGGNLTREMMTYLTGQPYSLTGRDNGPKAYDPNNRWVAKSALVVDSYVYSDATIFPQAYRDANVGIIVGDTVLNTGTYVSGFESAVLPGFTYNMPTLPVRQLDGTYYENRIIEPDIAVPFDPNEAGIGVDPQLEAAVQALMVDIGEDTVCD